MDIKWFIHRIRIISAPDILYRIKHLLKNQIQKTGLRFPAKRERVFSDNSLKHGAKLFLFEDIKLSEAVSEKIFTNAENYLKNKFYFLNHDYSFGEKIDWNFDPYSEKSIPLKFGKEIFYLNSELKKSAKLIWELNRFHYLITLAKANFKFAANNGTSATVIIKSAFKITPLFKVLSINSTIPILWFCLIFNK